MATLPLPFALPHTPGRGEEQDSFAAAARLEGLQFNDAKR